MPPRSAPMQRPSTTTTTTTETMTTTTATKTSPAQADKAAHEDEGHKQTTKYKTDPNYSPPIVWRNVLLMGLLHVGALVGLKVALFDAQWRTNLFAYALFLAGGVGITAGHHRLWSHRAYKAKAPFRALMAVLASSAFQNSILEWARDHRVHHKWAETDADPHNIERGFFFAHVGWLLSRKHPEVRAKGATIDLSDLYADPIVTFQHKYYIASVVVFCFVLPALIPHYLWGESLFNAFYVASLLRYALLLNFTWLINSASHYWGRKPYNDGMWASECVLSSLSGIGESFHNYHHAFPSDYAISELGYFMNLGKIVIDAFSLVGWTYDFKETPKSLVDARKQRTGDKMGPYNIGSFLANYRLFLKAS